MGELKVGDEVFDEQGNVTKVTAIFDEIPETAYRLTFSDGTAIEAGGEHQWVTWTHADRKAYLRSDYEEDKTVMPDNWPNWQPTQVLGGSPPQPREVIEEALELYRSGLSIRKTAGKVGLCRLQLTKHLKADHYIEPLPKKVIKGTLGPKVRTTDEIVRTFTHSTRGDTNHSIPTTKPLNLPPVELPIDPYVLGAWLGDGSKDGGGFTGIDPQIWERIEGAGYLMSHSAREAKSHRILGFVQELRALGVLNNKHIPAIYLRGSIQQRLDLLRGLMDTDGSADTRPEKARVEFMNTNLNLAQGVTELARSLGEKPVMKSKRATLYGKDCGEAWRVTWRPARHNPFYLQRKVEQVGSLGNQAFRSLHRMITKYEEIPVEPMRCITVDSPNSMYLVGDGMIPTHNTAAGAEYVLDLVWNQGYKRIALVGRTPADVRDVMIMGDSGIMNRSYPHPVPEHQPTKRRLLWPNGAQAFTYSAAAPSQLRGPQHDAAWVDELAAFDDASKGDALDTSWNNLMLGMRLGEDPKCIVTTTPKRVKVVKQVMERPTTVVTRSTTYENLANLAPSFREQVVMTYEGTRIGRQELMGEYLEDIEGALWDQGTIDTLRCELLAYIG